MTLVISEVALAKLFLVLGLAAFSCVGFASLVNHKQKGVVIK